MLETPAAQALLGEATVDPGAIRQVSRHLTAFLQRYLPLFYRREQRENAVTVIHGLLSDLERKTCEPIAYRKGLQRKPIQFFVGAGLWDDEAVMAEVRRHAVETIGDPNGILIIDPCSFPKKGTESCGVQRQWCGRLGKVDNCQVGVFLAYASTHGFAPMDRRLFLPEDWADDPERRKKCHVPADIQHRTKWEMAADLLARHGAAIPHGWVTADDDFGRPGEFRAWLREHTERYVLDVPCHTLVRDLDERRPPRRRAGAGRYKMPHFRRVDAWALRQPKPLWQQFHIRGGEREPIAVEAVEARVQAKQQTQVGPEERLIVVRSLGSAPRTWFVLSNAGPEVPLAEVVRVHAERHRIEQLLEEAKGETGLGHYEVRSWVGWHHHMTLSLLSLWFLQFEKHRLGGKNPRLDGPADPPDLLTLAS
jgi:SRSO17 transposase